MWILGIITLHWNADVWSVEKSVVFTRIKMTLIYVSEDSAIEIEV